MKKDNTKVVVGVILLLFGGFLLLKQFGLFYDIDIWEIFFKFWPLIFIILGIKSLIEKEWIAAALLIFLGCILLLSKFFEFNLFSVVLPLLIVGLGVFLLLEKSNITKTGSTNNEEIIDGTVLFSGREEIVTSEKFKGGELTAIFGGCELDLSNCKIAKDGAVLNLDAIFGGIEVKVPKNCAVVVGGDGIFGGWENKVESRTIKTPVLKVTGSAVFGGIEVKE